MTENSSYQAPWWADSETMAQYFMLFLFGIYSLAVVFLVLIHGFMPVKELLPWMGVSIYGIANFVVLLPRFRKGRMPLAIIQGVVGAIGLLILLSIGVASIFVEGNPSIVNAAGTSAAMFLLCYVGGLGQAIMHYSPEPIGGPLKPRAENS